MDIDRKAVALKYDIKSDESPEVLAKGQGYIAEKILKIAKDEQIPIYYSKDLVNLLFSLDIGQDIPQEFYEAIAEVIVYVMKIDKKIGDVI